MDLLLWLPLIFLALVAGWMVLLFAVALCERSHVRSFVRPDDASPVAGDDRVLRYWDSSVEPSSLTPYVQEMSAGAREAGFVDGELLSSAPKRHVKVLAQAWIDPQQTVVGLISGGTILRMQHRQTRLITRLDTGQVLITTDEFDAGDPSRTAIVRRVVNGSFDEILRAHRQQLDRYRGRLLAFAESSAADAFEAIEVDRIARMVERGRARYLDGGQVYWSYTVRGALCVCWNFVTQLLVGLRQLSAMDRRRPGE